MPDLYTVSPEPAKATDTSSTHDKIKATYEMLRQRWARFRTEALRNYEYVIGEQIDDDVRAELAEQNRPALVYNLMQNKIITIAGMLETNKAYMRAVPTGEGDNELSDMHTRLVSDWAMKGCNGIREISKAALDAAIGRIGWTNNYWTTRFDHRGSWITESCDPFMIMFDADARKQDQTDWRYYTFSGFYTADEIISVYLRYLSEDQKRRIREADANISGIRRAAMGGPPIGWFDRVWSGVQDMVTRTFKRTTGFTRDAQQYGTITDYVDSRMGRYRIIEFHDRRSVVKKFLFNPLSGESVPLAPQGLDETDEMYELRTQLTSKMIPGYKLEEFVADELWITVICPYLLPGEVIIEMPYPVQNAGFQHKPIFCYDLHPDITRTQAIIDILIDPQDSYNQRRMSFLEWIMDRVNPDVVAPVGAIDEELKAEWTSKERGKLKRYNPIQGAGPERWEPSSDSAGALKAFAEEDRDITEILTGITPNTQGLSESTQESGVLFAQKVQRAMTALSYYWGNMHESMENIFTYCDRNLQKFMDFPRKIRLLNDPTEPMWLTINMPTLMGVQNDITQGEYDFKVDPTVLGETMKQIKFAEAMQFVQVIASLNPALVNPIPLFDLWDSPISKEMKQYAEAMMQVQLQMAAQAQAVQATNDKIAQMEGSGRAMGALNAVLPGGGDPYKIAPPGEPQGGMSPTNVEVGP